MCGMMLHSSNDCLQLNLLFLAINITKRIPTTDAVKEQKANYVILFNHFLGQQTRVRRYLQSFVRSIDLCSKLVRHFLTVESEFSKKQMVSKTRTSFKESIFFLL